MRPNEALQLSQLTAPQLRQAKIEFAQACKLRVKQREERLAAEKMQQESSFTYKKEQLAEKLQALKDKK